MTVNNRQLLGRPLLGVVLRVTMQTITCTFKYLLKVYVFTALQGMQTRSSDEKAVRPSVCPSVKCVDCDKTEERSVQMFILYARSFSLVF